MFLQVWKAAIGGDSSLPQKVPYLATFVSKHAKAAGAAAAPGASAGGGAAASSANMATAMSPEEIAAKKKEREERDAADKAAAAEAAASHAKATTAATELQNQRTAKVLQLKQQNLEIGVALSCIDRSALPLVHPPSILRFTNVRLPDCATTMVPLTHLSTR
jgi:hypothetical protein